MNAQPPRTRWPSGRTLVAVVVLIFLLLTVFGLLSVWEDARNIPQEERPTREQVD